MPTWWQTILIPALALSLGWGVRGVVWGQRGAAIAGGIFGLTLGWVFGHPEPLALAAVSAVAFSYGGAETFEQTFRLARDAKDAAVYGWANFGLTLKGSVWIGLAGVWIGIASGHRAYELAEIVGLIAGQAILGWIGIRFLNRPHHPPEALPRLYFSMRRIPDGEQDFPRPEAWGGLWVAFLGVTAYAGIVKGDLFAVGMGVFGAAAGSTLPFAHAIRLRGESRAPSRWIDRTKAMELLFGGIAGAALGAGWRLSTAAGFAPGQHSLPTIPLSLAVVLLILWIFYFSASVLYVEPIWSLAQLPFVESWMTALPALASPYGPMLYLAGVLAAAASVANVRPYFCGEVLSLPVAMLIAMLATTGSLLAGWFLRDAGLEAWILLVLWFQTGWVVVGKAVPEKDAPRGRGYLYALGNAVLLSAALLLMAGVLTWIVMETR